MAISTVELRHLLQLSNFELFDFEYQFDDQKMKAEIEEAITNHFFFSEIGQETPDRFKHVFEHRFKSLIGYYNDLHNTTLLKYDPLVNYKLSEALEKLGKTTQSATNQNKQTDSRTGTQTNLTNTTQDYSDKTDSTSGSTSTNKVVTNEDETGENTNNDYPQNTISGDYRSERQDNTVLRNKTDNTTGNQDSTATGTTSGKTTGATDSTLKTTDSGTRQSDGTSEQTANHNESYQKTIEGMTGHTYQELIRLERENIIRIKSMIIEELKPCFMMVY